MEDFSHLTTQQMIELINEREKEGGFELVHKTSKKEDLTDFAAEIIKSALDVPIKDINKKRKMK